ncbi:MAG: FAD-binding domain-containing protein [Verrucomicrobiota bacterium]
MIPSTRTDALARLEAFIPVSAKYSRDRNHVFPFRHPNVSRLSPAIRHRLITEEETARAPLERYAESTLEKFTQEVYWRRYWKSWLSLRPQVWTNYRTEVEEIQNSLIPAVQRRLEQVFAGNSGLAIMDLFTRELLETGYMHNHARMWWAGWFIHVERLPWQLGAHFFYQHLLDADPASNTLSWKWVAGLQTPGKTYLPRRSNLEKYLPAELLAEYSAGLERLEKPQSHLPDELPLKPEVTRKNLPQSYPDASKPTLLWIHEDDLLPERSPLAAFDASHLVVTADKQTWQDQGFSKLKTDWLKFALTDTIQRAQDAFPKTHVLPEAHAYTPDLLLHLAQTHNLTQILTLRPEVGPLHDQLPYLEAHLAKHHISLHYLDRPEDLQLRPLATAGFFGFWKKLQTKKLLPQKEAQPALL